MTIEVLYTIFFFILGTIMGSFYNVVGYRLPQGMSIIKPPSHCPNCNHRLGVMELIPVLSYIIQLGRCKHCHKKIAIFYPIFELITGILFALSYYLFGFNNELLVALTFTSTLLIVIISDLNFMIIPDELLMFSGIMIIIERLTMGYSLVTLLLDAILAFIVLWLIKLLGDFMFKKESLGGGDIKLMIIFGLVIGWQESIMAIALGAFIALPVSIAILLIKKTNIIPFGPFLSIGALIIYYFAISYTGFIDLLISI
ncbi:MAG: prepilin peptidase [Bacilli bacterium]|jgi:leader peptidase (prepilin peptidase)/N-methyltransferase